MTTQDTCVTPTQDICVSAARLTRGSSGGLPLLRSPTLNANTQDTAPAPVTNVETVRMLTQNISQIADTSPIQHRRYSVPSTLGTNRSLALAVFEQGIERPSHRVRCKNNIKRLFVPPKQNSRMWLTPFRITVAVAVLSMFGEEWGDSPFLIQQRQSGWIAIAGAVASLLPSGTVGDSLNRGIHRVAGSTLGGFFAYVSLAIVTGGFTQWNHNPDPAEVHIDQPTYVVYVSAFVLMPALIFLGNFLGYCQDPGKRMYYIFTVCFVFTAALCLYGPLHDGQPLASVTSRVYLEIVGQVVGFLCSHILPETETDKLFKQVRACCLSFRDTLKPLIMTQALGQNPHWTDDEWDGLAALMARTDKAISTAKVCVEKSRFEWTMGLFGHPVHLSTRMKASVIIKLQRIQTALMSLLLSIKIQVAAVHIRTHRHCIFDGSGSMPLSMMSSPEAGSYYDTDQTALPKAYEPYEAVFRVYGDELEQSIDALSEALGLIPEVVDGAFRNRDEARAIAEIVVKKLAEAAEALGVMHDTRIKSEMIRGATCETILSTMFNRNCKEDEELIDDVGLALLGRNLLQESKLHARLYIDHSVSSAARYSLVDNVMVTTIVLVREMFEDLHGLLRLSSET